MIKEIGKKLLSGDFNLTTVSFPINVMLPLTILQTIAKSYFQFPIYMKLASLTPDPLERFKYVVVTTLSCFHKSSHFLKPMNPVLGETYEMLWEDGSKVRNKIKSDIFGANLSSSTYISFLYDRSH